MNDDYEGRLDAARAELAASNFFAASSAAFAIAEAAAETARTCGDPVRAARAALAARDAARLANDVLTTTNTSQASKFASDARAAAQTVAHLAVDKKKEFFFNAAIMFSIFAFIMIPAFIWGLPGFLGAFAVLTFAGFAAALCFGLWQTAFGLFIVCVIIVMIL
jgi:hypothetical protein